MYLGIVHDENGSRPKKWSAFRDHFILDKVVIQFSIDCTLSCANSDVTIEAELWQNADIGCFVAVHFRWNPMSFRPIPISPLSILVVDTRFVEKNKLFSAILEKFLQPFLMLNWITLLGFFSKLKISNFIKYTDSQQTHLLTIDIPG